MLADIAGQTREKSFFFAEEKSKFSMHLMLAVMAFFQQTVENANTWEFGKYAEVQRLA